MRDLLLLLRDKLAYLLRLEDAEEQHVVVDGIRNGVEFRGAKLWILVLAIFVASLGLNTNSAAVIIGAMLISPLMGPIIGMGLALGIYDMQLFGRSVRNYLIATLFSVLTATIYFLITPFSEAQSELLARTSPTIYDVLIALCGGLAGIIALGSRSQRTGNVIPGVAIATALMPPLCTVGFGIASGNWMYAAGAMYLFVINTIFIASATFIGAKWIMRFAPVADVDKAREKRTRQLVTVIALVTIIPSVFLTVNMVRESYFKRDASVYIQQEMHWNKTQVISHKIDYSNNTISVVLIGEEIDSAKIEDLRERMQYYNLAGTELQVMQTAFGLDEDEFQAMLRANNTELHQDEAVIAQQQTEILELQRLLNPYQQVDKLSREVYDELRLLYPEVTAVRMARGVTIEQDTLPEPNLVHETFVLITCSKDLHHEEHERIRSWLTQRTGLENMQIQVYTPHKKRK